MSLENAIYKMTALAAEHVGFADRGLIAPGYYADLVLLDPATVKTTPPYKTRPLCQMASLKFG